MLYSKFTTTTPSTPNTVHNFPSENLEDEKITVRCEICADCADATRKTLDAQGWGLYAGYAFCPYHEDQV